MDKTAGKTLSETARDGGKALRAIVPRSAHGAWSVVVDRSLTLDLLKQQEATRLSYLLPERHLRMSASPFAFYRGSALLMAADLSTTPTTGLSVQTCGDAHIANFGGFASPDRRLVFDINDFDETAPGPWEWDIKRLATSVEICGRDRGFDAAWRRMAVRAVAESYRKAMDSFARRGALDVWYARLDVERVLDQALRGASRKDRARVQKQLEKAYGKTSARAFGKLVSFDNGDPRIVFDPPYLVPLDRFASAIDADKVATALVSLLSGYRQSLTPDRRHLFDQYEYLDAAQKVVGVGSVGTRAWIMAFAGRTGSDPLVLQVKEAQQSVVERYAGHCGIPSSGERVVQGQRLMQSASDVMLGWTSVVDEAGVQRDYYVRQLWDWKTSTNLETASPIEIIATGCLAGWTLARAHARSGDRAAIAGYLGRSSAFDGALANFVSSYADQNEADYRVFIDALSAGSLTTSFNNDVSTPEDGSVNALP